ncbi:MAG: glycosyltransferase [Steroidobacteraceae bacterium]
MEMGDKLMSTTPEFGAVAIGRNEGDRLRRCLQSLSTATVVIYVDSGSSDGSVRCARDLGVDVVELDSALPYTAARARNAGFRRLREQAPNIHYVQFIDGDCEVRRDWHQHASTFLASHEDVAVVCGRRRERYPERSVYNWLCDHEWDGPVGEVQMCGGDAMMRVIAIDAVDGYRDELIAGEDSELCIRLRKLGWRIWRLPTEMTLHDAAITRFSQWWRRAKRCGYNFAERAYLHGDLPERYGVWESRRTWIWGICLPLICLALGMLLGPWGWAAWLIFPVQILRQTLRGRGSVSDRTLLALFQVLARFPEVLGQIKFMFDRILGRQAQLIEYK